MNDLDPTTGEQPLGPAADAARRFGSDQAVFQFVRAELHVPAVCDVLDSLGYRGQAMHQRLRPLLPDARACGFVGRAKTIRWMEMDHIDQADPYGLEIEAIDSLQPGEVVVHSTDLSGRSAPWGELLTTVAKRRGAVGCVCDGMVRDCTRIIEMGFPVYCAGILPLDSNGRTRVMAYDVPVRCGNVVVRPRDLVFADFDGVVVVPKEVEDAVLTLAQTKVQREGITRQALQEGQTLRAVFDRYRVL
jgi:regulator of RNase E activity RraA